MDICTSVTLIEKHPTAGDLLEVVINNDKRAYWFHPYTDALQFLNQEVIVEFRKDVYKGELQQFVNTFTVRAIVNTLDKQDNFKLYCDQEDNFANLSFTEIADGESRQGCIVFCTAQTFKSSTKATWVELIIRDKMMRTAVLRIFDYINKDEDFTGKYIMTELSRSQHGFQSTFAKVLNGECPPNPEIEIGKQYVLNYFKGNSVAMDFISKAGILDALDAAVDFEQGYGYVRLAMELAMVDSMKNITKDVDLEAIGCALLASRASILRTSIFSPMVNNIFLARQFPWENKNVMLPLLDDVLEEHTREYSVMKNIQATVGTLLDARKGTTF